MAPVEYERSDIASRYARGRDLEEDVLLNWRAAVQLQLPADDGLDVLDIGAGTGIFARAWSTWFRSNVIAAEPSAAMRRQMFDDGVPAAVRVVGARAEHLPLRDASVHVAWLSAVLHHLSDVDRCAQEVARVLHSEGVVLVRGLFADLGEIPGIELLPGAERAVQSFPAVADVERAFGRCGLRLISAHSVEDAGPRTIGQAVDRVRDLRSADTLLRQFSDDEIGRGLREMSSLDPTQPMRPARLGMLALSR